VAAFTNPRGFALAPIELSRLSGSKMKGFALVQLIATIEAEHGREVVDAWRSSLTPAHQALVEARAVTSVAWVPVEFYYHLAGFVIDAKHGGDVRQAIDLGAAVASREINAFFRMVLNFTTPSMVMSLSGRFWRSYYDGGELAIVEARDRFVHGEVRGWAMADLVSMHEMAGSLVRWMQSSSAKDVKLERFELVAPGCFRVDATW
jgi:hypothetical protein